MTELMVDPGGVLVRYAEGPGLLRAAIEGLTDAGLDMAPNAENWTIRHIVHHIVDGDHLWGIGIKAALGNCDASFGFQWYWAMPQMQWAERWAYAQRDVGLSLALFEASRRHIVSLLQAAPDAWERTLLVQWPHREPERVTVGRIVEMQAGHAAGHVEDILKIRQMFGI